MPETGPNDFPGVGTPLATLLSSRGIQPGETSNYLQPTDGTLNDPGLLPGIDKAVDRLKRAINDKTPVLVYADYDVDGIIGGLLVYQALKELGAECRLFLPDRHSDGYGLNMAVMERAVENDVGLVLSVDCGISNNRECDFLKSAGVDLIVTDHHEPPGELPDAFAIVDPKIGESSYPYRDLAGAVVGAKVVAALKDSIDGSGAEFIERNLTLLALATVVDVCPVTGENRTIIAKGLSAFNDSAPPGLKELVEQGGRNAKDPDSFTFGFVIGPRLNAAGRLESPKLAASLLTATDGRKINTIVKQLENLNRLRKRLTSQGLKDAKRIIEKEESPCPIITLYDKSWHEGVIGLIAGGMAGMFRRPALIATTDGHGFCKGSGRTSGNFDLLGALRLADGCLENYGGHQAAVGFKLKECDFDKFADDVAKSCEVGIHDDIFTSGLRLDGKLDLGDLGQDDVRELDSTAPWGSGNESPRFLFENLDITACDTMGDGTHVRMKFRSGGKSIDAIGFGFNPDGRFLTEAGPKADVAGTPEIDEYGGRRKVRIRMEDIRFH